MIRRNLKGLSKKRGEGLFLNEALKINFYTNAPYIDRTMPMGKLYV